ncbi:hypothetical protein RclHR1_10540001 [Rhizophagus clarus]|uniref:P-loop containing nucleoside triphosphate hydrolase protein n=1 Tax=Rhizophagus clarus TaxID=94130 RepID=A0A2Z6Q300_9GLOM|nr:hypothetical protein RclHR1_10540001 [Rhizophagus clarus]GES99371.1 P-loop containing nucleoside triphosphate hydrolase protein [Rhizophagus clarus]
MAPTSTKIPDVKGLKEISNDEIIKELKEKGSSAKILNVIHVTKPSSEKYAGSSESSSDKKHSSEKYAGSSESSSDKKHSSEKYAGSSESSSDKKHSSEKYAGSSESSSDKKHSSEKYAGSSESSSDKKHSIVISEEGALWFKSYDVWLITYESTSEEKKNITTKKYFEDKKFYSKEIALGEAIDIELKLKEDINIELELKDKETKNDNKDDFKNILLIGRTGDGKSAIANVLVGEDEEGNPYFEESACGISKTKKAKMRTFGDEKKYKIIDTIGIGGTKLPHKKVIEDIIKAIHKVNFRFHHIFFVTRGRMTRGEINTFKLLRSVIFCDKDKDNGEFLFEKYTTLVRTGFGEFEDPIECRRDIELMIRESKEINHLISSCRAGLTIYIDNPPVYILKGLEKEKEVGQEKRKQSRKILLESLEKLAKEKKRNKQDDYYEAKNMRELFGIIKKIKMVKEILEEKKKHNNDGNDKTVREEELKKAYKKKKEDLKNLVHNKTRNYEKDKVMSIKTDDDAENDQSTSTFETTLTIAEIMMNAFVPGLGSEVSHVITGLKSVYDYTLN